MINSAEPVTSDLDRSWTAAELLKADFPDIVWKVQGLLPEEGYVLVAGKRKIGKGWFTLQIAHALSSGDSFLGRATKQCRVLVYALEDNPRRIRRRIAKQGAAHTDDIVFRFRWPGWKAVATEILKGGFAVCIVDTLSRATPGVDQKDVVEMTEVLSEWQEFGLTHGVLIIATDHERKGIAGSAHSMDEVMGSQAKTAVADAVIQLHRAQGKHDTILSADGRDFEEEVEWVVKFDRQKVEWEVVGTVADVKQGEARRNVLDAIDQLQNEAKELPITKRIAKSIKKSDSYVNGLLADLVADEELVKGGKIGKEQPYFLPSTDVSEWYESSNDDARQ